jgi:hypothetical protein
VADQSQSSPMAGEPGGTNATWRTTSVRKASWCRLSREDLSTIRAKAIKFISQSNVPADAHIEWYLTWPRKNLRTPKADEKPADQPLKGVRFRQELRATEIGDGLWKAGGVPGLDAIASEILEYEGRQPRVFRYIKFSAVAPGYELHYALGDLLACHHV